MIAPLEWFHFGLIPGSFGFPSWISRSLCDKRYFIHEETTTKPCLSRIQSENDGKPMVQLIS
ncbi:hypothetical protein ACVWYN_000592 [Pedobacter sp. UYP24]